MFSLIHCPSRSLCRLAVKLVVIGLVLLCTGRLFSGSAKAADQPAELALRARADQPTPWVTIGSRLWLEDDNDGNAATGTVVSVGAGHIVRATATNGGAVYIGVTDANGNYTIVVPAFATYIVTADPLPGYTDSPVLVNDGADPVNNNNRNHKRTGTTVVMTDVDNLSIDFGFYHHVKMVQLGDRLWLEDDNDGDAATGAVTPVGPGHVVTALASDGKTAYTGVTDANGYYLIAVPEYDTYWVTTALPAGALDTPVWANHGNNPSRHNNKNHERTGTTVIIADRDNLSIDFGFTRPIPPPLVALGDRVWLDANLDGQQNDAHDPLVAGLAVTLLNPQGQPLQSTTTNAAGYYSFTNLLPGDYMVAVHLPAGYGVTTGGADPDADAANTDSNALADGARLVSHAVTLGIDTEPLNDNLAQAGRDASGNGTVDFGLIKLVRLGDLVWEDRNGNGQQEAGEPGIPNVQVTLRYPDNTTMVTTTDARGIYTFTNLLPNTTYMVTYVTPNGYTPTLPNSGGDTTDSDPVNSQVTVNLGARDDLTIDAGFVRPVTVGDRVWYDHNHDGRQADANSEAGVAGVLVTLYNAATNQPVLRNGAPLTASTNSAGAYLFTTLPPGAYFVVFGQLPAGYGPTLSNVGDDAGDSDADATGRTAATAFLPSGAADLTLDLGIWRAPASLGDWVWEDRNGNGRQEAGEPPIAAVIVTLTGADGSTATTTTDANGVYTFTNLIPGLGYTVTFTPPAGFTPTPANSGADDAVDSDGLTVAVPPLEPGQHNPTFDSGFVRLQSSLRFSKQATTAPSLIQPGAVVTYTLRYTNVGNGPALGVVITETVSAHTKFFARSSSSGWGCADGAAAGTLCPITVGDLQPGQSGLVLFAVKIDLGVVAGTSLVNAAVIGNQQVAGVSSEAISTIAGPTDIPVGPEPGGQNNQRIFLPLITR